MFYTISFKPDRISLSRFFAFRILFISCQTSFANFHFSAQNKVYIWLTIFISCTADGSASNQILLLDWDAFKMWSQAKYWFQI